MRSCSRIVTLLLTACLLLGSFCALPALAANGPVTVDAHNGGSMGPKQITSDYCIRVNLGAPFTKLTAVMPTWGQADAEASLALYKWDVDYNTTLASEPIAYKLFSPLVDCATNELTFDPQPAGEYLFRIADIKGTVGAGDSFAAGCLYGIYNGFTDAEILEFASGAAACNLAAEDSVSGMRDAGYIRGLIGTYGKGSL